MFSWSIKAGLVHDKVVNIAQAPHRSVMLYVTGPLNARALHLSRPINMDLGCGDKLSQPCSAATMWKVLYRIRKCGRRKKIR